MRPPRDIFLSDGLLEKSANISHGNFNESKSSLLQKQIQSNINLYFFLSAFKKIMPKTKKSLKENDSSKPTSDKETSKKKKKQKKTSVKPPLTIKTLFVGLGLLVLFGLLTMGYVIFKEGKKARNRARKSTFERFVVFEERWKADRTLPELP